jgi:hypothetical protein
MLAVGSHTQIWQYFFCLIEVSATTHNPLYNVAKQAEPQLYWLTVSGSLNSGKYLTLTLEFDDSGIKKVPMKCKRYNLKYISRSSGVGFAGIVSSLSLNHVRKIVFPLTLISSTSHPNQWA